MGGKSQQSSSQVTIPPEVLARYNAVNAQAQQTATQPFQQYSSDPNAFVAPMTTAQNMGLQQTANYANAAQPSISEGMDMTRAGSAAADPSQLNSQAINQYMNPYTQNVTDQMTKLMNQQFQTAQSGQMGNAIKSGAFGGDRAGVAAANLGGQQALAYGNAMAPVLQQGYNTALQTATGQQALGLQAQQANLARQMQGGAQMAGLGQAGQTAGLAGAQAMMGAGQVQQQTQQAGNTALYNQFLQQQSYPFQVSQFLANIAEGTGALSGQTTTSTQPSSFFSDRRLKTDVKRIGTAKNGLPIHSFRYKDDPEHLTRLGFMADEVEKKHPEAVGLAGGYKTVDHERALRASGGGTVTDYDQGQAYDRGGYYEGGYAGGVGSMYDPSWSGIDQRQQANESRAGQGAAPAGSPYGGVSRHVPVTPKGEYHLPAAPTPPKQQESGLQQAGALLGKAKEAYGLFNTAGEAKDRFTNWASGSGDSGKSADTTTDKSTDTGGGSTDTGGAAPEDLTYYRGGLSRAGGGEAESDLPAIAAASKAGVAAPGVADVVTPTAAYKQGLGEAQAAQVRANEEQDKQRQQMATLGITTTPDLTPFGQMMNAQGVQSSAKVYGSPGGYYDPTEGGNIFKSGNNTLAARGGLIGYALGGAPGDDQPDQPPPDQGGEGGDQGTEMYQGSKDPNSTQDTTKLDIADEKPTAKLPPPPQPPPPQKSGLGDALGILGKVAGIATMFASRGGLAGRRGYDEGGEALESSVDDIDTSDRQPIKPDLSAGNTDDVEQQNAQLMEHVPRERLHEVMTPKALAAAYPPTQKAPAPGLATGPTAEDAALNAPLAYRPTTTLADSDTGEPAPYAGLEPPSRTEPETVANVPVHVSTGSEQRGAEPVEGSGFDQPLNTSKTQFAQPAGVVPENAPEPGVAAAANALRRSPEAAALAGVEEARRGKAADAVAMQRDYDARHAQSWSDSLTGVKPDLAPENPEQEQARFARYDSTTPTTREEATAGPMTQPGLRPSDTTALAKLEEKAPAAAEAEKKAAKADAGLGAATAALPTFARAGIQPSSGLGAAEKVTSPAAPIPGSTAAPVPAKMTPAKVAAPAPARIAPAAKAAAPAAPVDQRNPVQKFFGDLFGGAQQGAKNVVSGVQQGAKNVVGGVQQVGQNVSGALTAGANQLLQGSPKMAPSGDRYVGAHIDPRLTKVITEGTRALPDGYTARLESGFREGDPRFHGKGMATDVAIYDPQGHRLANYQDPTTFRMYERLAQGVRSAQQHLYPELGDQMRWGGYFSGGKGKYGALDLMHFDLGGGHGLGMVGGSWEKGLTPQQKALFPGAESIGMGQRPPEGYPVAATGVGGSQYPSGGNGSQFALNASKQNFGDAYKSGIQGILGSEEKFRAKPYWDKATGGGGAWAIGYGTHQIMGVDGRMRPVQQGDTITPEAAYTNMATRLKNEYLPAAMRKVGGPEAWRALPRNVRDGLGSVIWNHGHLPDSVAAAVRSGDRNAIANAVANLSSNPARRQREAAHIRGGG